LRESDGWELALENISHRDDLVANNYRKTYAHNISVNQNLLVEILNSRTDKQDLKASNATLKDIKLISII